MSFSNSRPDPRFSVNLDSEQPQHDSCTTCQPCQMIFQTWEDYQDHMLNSIAHRFCCDICFMDFRCHKAYKRHRELMHPLAQKLQCQTCSKTFPRLGSLVAHIESSKCKSMTESQLALLRRRKLEAYESQKAARSFKDFNRCDSQGTFNNEPLPMSLSVDRTINHQNPHTPSSHSKIDEDEDLITFDSKAAHHNSMLVIANNQSSEMFNSNTIQSESKLNGESFSVDAKEGPNNTFDPKAPGFQAERFYIPILKKFKCPHRGCGKTIETKSGFVKHLLSQAHTKDKLQCINCLKYFATATALTQHCESQSLKCRVRETDGYEQMVDIMTSGLATIAGRHQDNTHKYTMKNNEMRSRKTLFDKRN